MKKQFVIILFSLVTSLPVYSIDMTDLIERKEIKAKITSELLKLDVGLDVGLGSIDLIDGVNLSSKYRYSVEPSYQDKYFTRMDNWKLKTNINAGTLLKDHLDLPFSFNISRENSFVFVRQFKSKIKALEAIPYTPAKLPITAYRALKLNIGDFVSIPANLNLGFSASMGTSYVTQPAIINASVTGFFIVNGEFTIQIYKLDEKHVRLKLIANRALNGGVSSGINAELNFLGFKVAQDKMDYEVAGHEVGLGSRIDKELKKQTVKLVDRFVDREFFRFGINYTKGASYIADYVFDLSDPEAILAYEQILSSAYKLKDIVVIDHFLNAKALKDKLITTTELADKLSEKEANLPAENRKVTRIFKGFTDYKALNRGIKLGLLVASYQHNSSYVENKLTLIDRNNHSLEFFYPTMSKYFETNFGKWFFNLKDQANKLYFGLIPRRETEVGDFKNPDFGLTFERKDKTFTRLEQKGVTKFMLNQLPLSVIEKLDLHDWKNGSRKIDARIFFQVILKSQGFNYLRVYSQKELTELLIKFLNSRKLLHIIVEPEKADTGIENNDQEEVATSKINPNTLAYDLKLHPELAAQFLTEKQVLGIAALIYHSLHDETNVSESTLTKLIKLNEIPLFANAGIGFLTSLIPEDKLSEYIYVKLEMSAADIEPVSTEFGELNYKNLYNEINTIQGRLSNRSYDLRISKEDIESEETNADVLEPITDAIDEK